VTRLAVRIVDLVGFIVIVLSVQHVRRDAGVPAPVAAGAYGTIGMSRGRGRVAVAAAVRQMRMVATLARRAVSRVVITVGNVVNRVSRAL